MISGEQFTKRRGGRTVVSDVTFRCEPGTIAGFSDPSARGF
jgi:ABC-2 type transport system ATP-binding protein